MGYQTGFQPKLFYHQINLDQRVPQNHILRKIEEQIDFDFIYDEVEDCYGDNGNVSVPPPVILKMMLLLILYNVRSERELMDTIPLRLDWLWFLGYDLDSEIVDHSVLSKARRRWGVEAHIPDLGECSAKRAKKSKIFSEERFEYDPQGDTYRCPGGNLLRPKSLHKGRESRDYAAPKKVCAVCYLRKQCTKNKSGRTIKRHLRQEELDEMREASRSRKAKQDIKTRQHLMERSFARGTWYGFDRARWRGLWRVQIQEYLISSVQNIQVLLRYGDHRKKSLAGMVNQVKEAMTRAIGFLSDRIKGLTIDGINQISLMEFVHIGIS